MSRGTPSPPPAASRPLGSSSARSTGGNGSVGPSRGIMLDSRPSPRDRVSRMVWFYERHGTFIRCETRESPTAAFELVIINPDGTEKVERSTRIRRRSNAASRNSNRHLAGRRVDGPVRPDDLTPQFTRVATTRGIAGSRNTHETATKPPPACRAPGFRVFVPRQLQLLFRPCGECSSVVEHRTVAPVVAGSIPVTHPNLFLRRPPFRLAVLAQGRRRCYGCGRVKTRLTDPDNPARLTAAPSFTSPADA